MVQQSHVVLIEPSTSEIQHLPKATFSELGVKERQQLEAWILSHPEVLGERLLILTCEFDKFDKSDKRLDILALDAAGKLVIVELKREVGDSLAELQAIRYAAFCSTMKFNDVVALRAEYTNAPAEQASEEIRQFVKDPSYSKVDNQPRIILAASRFDNPDLTSCVLWLRTFRLDIRCVELAPYKLPDKRLVLVPKTLIPLPEAGEFIVKVEEKEAMENAFTPTQLLHQGRNREILACFRELLPGKAPDQAPLKNYMQIPTGHTGVHFEWWRRLQGANKQLDVAIHFETNSKQRNRELCEMLRRHRSKIESATGEKLTFDPEWGQQWSAVYMRRSAEPWSGELAKWGAQKMMALISEVQPLLDDFYQKTKLSD